MTETTKRPKKKAAKIRQEFVESEEAGEDYGDCTIKLSATTPFMAQSVIDAAIEKLEKLKAVYG